MKSIVLLCTLVFIVLYSLMMPRRQHQTMQNHGVGSDGLAYMAFYQVVSGHSDFNFKDIIDSNYYGYAKDNPTGVTAGKFIKASFPFNQRILVPYIASLLPFEPMVAFRVINLSCFAAALAVLLLFWLRVKKYEPVYIAMALLWMSLAFMSPLRYAFYDPFFIDGPTYIFLALLVVLADSQRYFLLVCLIALIALFAKESVLLIIMLCFMYHLLKDAGLFGRDAAMQGRRISRATIQYGLLTAGLFAASYYYKHYMAVHYGFSFKSSFAVVFMGIRYLFSDPTPFVRYASALLFGYSMLFAAAVVYKPLKNEVSQNTFLAIGLLMMSPLLGSDILRYMVNWMPVVFTWLLLRLDKKDLLYHIMLLVFSLPLLHIFASIPDPMILHPSSDADGFNDMYGYHSWQPQAAHIGLIAAYLVYAIVFVAFLRAFKQTPWYDKANAYLMGKLVAA